ncbi:tetratricopeptide repeat protein [Pontibacter sp. JH31]|uniref:Tetratricopeptide repeat protein n=1 Tax=Pontibacter aquaedesilientis TaxID=2766980 RepID=A0ABR7XHQ0_9BACT|nr:tetratricopeptide repeat protein [Pontibacter aquaedesilientis]MBD1397764.1 tetratricopeptide repeat protein [Pontibacter aquaedesilientis]
MNISRIITIVLTIAGISFLVIILSDPYFFTDTKKIQKTAEAKLEEGILGNKNAFKEASYYLNSLIEQGKDDRQTHELLYWSYRYDKNFERAEKALDEALEIYPEDPAFLYHRAEMRLELGKYEQALQDYDAVIPHIEKQSYYYDALYSRGAARYKLGLKAEAEADFRKAQSLTKDTLQAYTVYFKE